MNRLIIFGVDGGTLDIVRPLCERGLLPNFQRLLADGVSGELASTFPPMTFPAFTTFMTGKNPGGHGVFDFFERAPGRYGVRFVNAGSRRGKSIWRMLSEAGRRVAVIGFPVTYPPEQINGVMISGFDAPGIGARADRTCFWPREFYDELREHVGEYIITPTVDMRRAYKRPGEGIAAIERTIERKLQTALYVMERERWDCFAFMLIESDFGGHRYWKYYDPNSPHFDPAAPAELRDGLPRVYRAIDDCLGKLMERAGDAGILVFSDHGFGGACTKAVYVNRFLEQQGALRFAASNTGKGGAAGAIRLTARLLMAKLKDIGLHYLPEAIRTPLLRSMKLGNQIESRIRFGGIDWRHTQVYSDESPYFPAMWINLQGRDPAGIVPPDQYDQMRDRVIGWLSEWRDPESGHPLVRRVFRAEEIYSGGQIKRAPDLLIDWNLDQGYSYLSGRSLEDASGAAIRRLALSEFWTPEMTTRSGSHRPNGLIFAHGGPFAGKRVISGASLTDLAPTILFCQGLPLPADIEGRVLQDLYKPEFLETNVPSASGDSAAGGQAPQGDGSASDSYTDEERAIIERRLRDLGYI
ncbi:MAG: alkaline phosphatase family protein [Candidatus Binataceae bacterium]|jgi:predicted AlkP superfamily phosphohydrolase/phosphomutase